MTNFHAKYPQLKDKITVEVGEVAFFPEMGCVMVK